MRRDSRLWTTLHIILHMAELDGPVTSEELGLRMGVNPVVLRKVMGGLREKGLLTSVKGHGGGWSIKKDLSKISLLDIYKALGEPILILQNRENISSNCAVEKIVGRNLNETYQEAEELIMKRFSKISLAQMSAEFHELYKEHQRKHPHAHSCGEDR